eukprot:UN07161
MNVYYIVNYHPKFYLQIFHTQLAGLLNKIVKTNAATWKNNIMQNQISAPRLVDFNYRIDNTVSTDQMTNVNASSLLLNLHVQMQQI